MDSIGVPNECVGVCESVCVADMVKVCVILDLVTTSVIVSVEL
jgi:hypothetical protein